MGSGTKKTHHGQERARTGSFHLVKVDTRPITRIISATKRVVEEKLNQCQQQWKEVTRL
jgi:hypothetical protein